MIAELPGPVDDKYINAILARNLKTIRVRKRLSLKTVAAGLGISYQQVQKYENGKDRVAAARLYQIACYHNMPLQCFFTGAEGAPEN